MAGPQKRMKILIVLLFFYFHSCFFWGCPSVHAGGPWRIGAGLPQLERDLGGCLTGVKPGKRGSVQGLSPRFWSLFFLRPRPRVRLSVYGQISAKKSGGGGEPWCRDQPPLGRYPPPCRRFTRDELEGVGGPVFSVPFGIVKTLPIHVFFRRRLLFLGLF
jgi:hypothetical protein